MILVSNWKAYVEDLATARSLAKTAGKFASKGRTIVLVPSAPMVTYVREYASKKVSVGVQDVSDVDGGAATGEVSARIAHGAGARYSIIGHSERRARGESNELVAHKVRVALDAGLIPIVCIGERERDVDALYLTGITEQLDSALAVVPTKDRKNIIVAYEPVWAIGKSAADAMTPDDLAEMVRYLRKRLEHHMDSAAAAAFPLLYGGSVDASNVKELLSGTGINGLLVGHASADPKTYAALMKALG